MATHEDANLILKLYELRREPKLREARDWYASKFRPQSAQEVLDTMMGADGVYMRMVASYWEMSAALVNHGSIDRDLFFDTNGEQYLVYATLEPFLSEIRERFSNPNMFANLEKLVQESPNGKQRVAWWQERIKAESAKQQTAAGA